MITQPKRRSSKAQTQGGLESDLLTQLMMMMNFKLPKEDQDKNSRTRPKKSTTSREKTTILRKVKAFTRRKTIDLTQKLCPTQAKNM